MVFDGLTWKTSPGACEVEPPVSGSGPWSTTVTRSTPRAVSSSARLAPTTPAPMMTTRGEVDMRTPWFPYGGGAVVVGVGQRAVRYSVAASSSQLVTYPANDERTTIW